ncbi:lipoprotein NlpI [Zophobihabitans entericus]|uniref:Lipoprotein NlpI n=1 Tax=Zophobihabitans entericus TaxID=1635327 RepID=A0A6G9ICE8_9GAMM|nr:lipoprotein NlpI [Zophobihabitans entericus]QIQ21502.1 lipoprotein NlpI [Zophobihabitans entericus]
MKFVGIKCGIIALIAIFLSGCNTLGWYKDPVLAIPERPTYEDEVKIARLGQQLNSPDIDDDTRLHTLFLRGVLYDSIGLRAYAQSDMTLVMAMRPDLPEVYNYLGTFAIDQDDSDAAYMAFNTALELDPESVSAHFNRGLVSYRGERYSLALDDVLFFYNDKPEDAIRLLWVYLVDKEIDSKAALKSLQERYDQMEDQSAWGGDIVAFYLGKISESTLMENTQKEVTSNRQLAERLTEVYFYLGKYYLSKGNEKRAETLFKYSLANNIYNYIEYKQALIELNLLEKERNQSN